MALLDVNDILSDADLVSGFTVLRRKEIINRNGRSEIEETRIPGQLGVITANSPNDLQRAEDYQNMPRAITVVTPFPAYGVVVGYQPDVILWKGSQYVVRAVDHYSQFGRGFYQLECTSMEKTDPAIDPALDPNTDFSLPKNSSYLMVVI